MSQDKVILNSEFLDGEASVCVALKDAFMGSWLDPNFKTVSMPSVKLSPDEARALAEELTHYADVAEGKA